MKKFTLSLLLLGAACSMNAQQQYVLFEDDFSWLLPWAQALNANGQACGDPIGKNDVSDAVSVSRALNNIKLDVDGTEVSADRKVLDMGYELLIKYNSSLAAKSAGNAVYLQRQLDDNDEATGVYLKFGLTGYSTGITTPALEKAGLNGVNDFTVSFDWAPQRQTGGAYDKTHLAIYVGDGTETGSRVNLEDHTIASGSALEWHHVDVPFDSFTLKGTDRITIRPGANQWPGGKTAAYRFYLKDLKITTTTVITGVDDVTVDGYQPVEYYNLQGIRITEPVNGLYIVRQGNKVTKKYIQR